MNRTENFLNNIERLYNRTIPENVMFRAKQSLLDYISVSAAGSKYLDEKLKKYIDFAEPEQGNYKVIGLNEKYTLKEAVFLNGLCGHALDFDDGTNAGIIHLGSPIFSLLIPLACKYKKNVEEMLKAAVVGYEVSFTIAVSMQPIHKFLGYHATGTCGILGAAVAASYLLGFSKIERMNAFSTACISSTGVLKVLDDDAELKPYNVAKASLMALTSLQIAKAGFKGHNDALSGERGFFKMMTGNQNIELKPILLDGTYAIEKSYTKPYAACRYLHPAIEGAIKIYSEDKLNYHDIETVTVKTYSLAVQGHNHSEIFGSSSAKMSIPYSIAVGLIYGKAGLYEFDNVNDKEVLNFAKCVKVIADEEMSTLFPKKQVAEVIVKMKNGEVYLKRTNNPKGEPENPLNEKEFEERFMELISYAGMKEYDGETLYRMVMFGSCDVCEIVNLINTEEK